MEAGAEADLIERKAARAELLREATTMVLYVSVVMIAELAALPERQLAGDAVAGPSVGELLAILWGTALGLAIAHWFAFRVAGPAFRGDNLSGIDPRIGLAQVGGAAFVAFVSSLPLLVLKGTLAREVTIDVPAFVIGIIGFAVARSAGKSRLQAAFYGGTALAVGVLVALVKNTLAGH